MADVSRPGFEKFLSGATEPTELETMLRRQLSHETLGGVRVASTGVLWGGISVITADMGTAERVIREVRSMSKRFEGKDRPAEFTKLPSVAKGGGLFGRG